MANIAHLVDKKFEGMDFEELVGLPVDALQGVSTGDAEALKKAFNVKTIGDLGRNKFVLAAVAMVGLAGTAPKTAAAAKAPAAKK